MDATTTGWTAQASGWRTLMGLRPRPLDLQRISLIREADAADLRRSKWLEDMIPRLGLNDEGLTEFPQQLHAFCGGGLRIWQYPTQFARYLATLTGLGVRSYLELGIRHGGSFVATVEVLDRFRPLDFAVGVDIIACEAMAAYRELNPRIEFACVNTQSAQFSALLQRLAPVDLVFIDSHHEENQCRREVDALRGYANMIALHDISNKGCPGIATVWNEMRSDPGWQCHEFTDQYDGLGPFMGIGLAINKTRTA